MEQFALNDLFLLAVGILIAGAYWALVVFPRQRDFQKRQLMARELAAGDEVVTGGGLIGKVIAIDAEQGVAQVEVSDGVVLRLVVAALIRRYDPEEIAENARRGLESPDEAVSTG